MVARKPWLLFGLATSYGVGARYSAWVPSEPA